MTQYRDEVDMSKSEIFWDKMAEGYANSAISDEVSYQKKLSETQGLFSPNRNITASDLLGYATPTPKAIPTADALLELAILLATSSEFTARARFNPPISAPINPHARASASS